MRRPRRPVLVVAAASVAAHLLALFLLGRSVPRPYVLGGVDAEPAVTVTLLPRSPQPLQQPARQAAAIVRRHLTVPSPLAPPSIPTPAPPVTPGPAPSPAVAAPAAPPGLPAPPAAGPDAAALRLGRALRRHTACADPDGAGLSAEEWAACAERLAEDGGPVLGLGIAPGKQAGYDRAARCAEYDRAHIPPGLETSNVAGGMAGLGQVPRSRDCPPGH